MPLEVQPAQRIFKFNEQLLDDPNPAMSSEEVIDFYAIQFPEMAAAQIAEPVINDKGELVYELKTKIGTKG